MKVMTTRHQLHMQLFTFNGFGLSLNLGVDNMATWHMIIKAKGKNLNNVKVKQRFRRRSGVGELDTQGRCNNYWKPATLHMTICYGLKGRGI